MELVKDNFDEVLGEPFEILYGYTARKVEESYRGMMAVIDMAAKSGHMLCREMSFYSPNTRTENDPYCILQYGTHFLRTPGFNPTYAVFKNGEFTAAVQQEPGFSLLDILSPRNALDMHEDELDRIEDAVDLVLPKNPRYSENEMKRLMRSDDPADFLNLALADGNVHSYERIKYANRLDWLSLHAPLDVRLVIASNQMAHAETIGRMMREDPDWRVRRAAFWKYGRYDTENLELYRLASLDPSPEVRLVMPLLFTLKNPDITRIFMHDRDEVVRCAAAFNYIGDDGSIYAELAESGRNERKYLLNKAGSLPDGVLKHMLEVSEDPDEQAAIMIAMLEEK